MKHDFTGKSIKCDTWEQMLHLAKLAEEQRMQSGGFSKKWFDDNNGIYFETTSKMYFCNLQKPQEKVVISYCDFVNTLPTEVVEVTGCGDCKLSSWNHSRTGVFCALQYTDEMSPNKLFTSCPLKTKSLTIQLKQND